MLAHGDDSATTSADHVHTTASASAHDDDGALAAALTSLHTAHAEALATLRKEHANDARASEWLANDVVVARYLVAHNGSWTAAVRGLDATIKWRREHVPAHLHCQPCASDSGSHAFVPLGLDSSGRPLIYGCHARAANQEANGMVRHVVHTVEHVLRVSGHHGSLRGHQWRWVIDFNGE